MMNEDVDRDFFNKVLSIDKMLWDLIKQLSANDHDVCDEHARKIIKISGEIHVDIMRPLYKKYPDLVKYLEED